MATPERKAWFLKTRGKLIQILPLLNLPPWWSVDPLQQVFQKNATQVITETLGHELAYTREAYKKEHQDRDPEADGLTSQSMEIDGDKHQDDKLPAAPRVSLRSSGAGAGNPPSLLEGSTGPTPSVAGGAQSVRDETPAPHISESEDEAQALGLKSRPSDKKKAGPKRKRTTEEILSDQVMAVSEEVALLLDKLSSFPDAPKFADVSRVDRMASRKHKELKDAHHYEQAGEVKKMLDQIEALRNCYKVGVTFLTGTQASRKKATGEFLLRFDTCQEGYPEVYTSFSQTVRRAHVEASFTHSVEKREWSSTSRYMEQKTLALLYDDVGDRSARCMEAVIGSILKQHEDPPDLDAASKNLVQVLERLVDVVHEDIQEPTKHIVCLAKLDVAETLECLEEAIASCLSKKEEPIYRALQQDFGLKLLQMAEAECQKRALRRDSLASVAKCQVFFENFLKEDDVKEYLETGKEESLEQTLKKDFGDKCVELQNLLVSGSEMLIDGPKEAAFMSFVEVCNSVLSTAVLKRMEARFHWKQSGPMFAFAVARTRGRRPSYF
ncbi:unnamed protein product [Symbiodinium sp. CCMP2592]|nr:unnamed protein product [Symbiodinium sp. CCMP2592]